MYKKSNPLFLICETPLHAGSGSDLGVVDLPIQRERHTSFPKIEGSSLKGALRQAFEQGVVRQLAEDSSNIEEVKVGLKTLNRVFGYDGSPLRGISKDDMDKLLKDDEKEFSGCISVSDARLLLFPVKSMRGVFAWITCPRVLRRFEMDMKTKDTSFSIENLEKYSFIGTSNVCYTQGNPTDLKVDKYVILEEYTFEDKAKDLLKIKDTNHQDGCALGEWLCNNRIVDVNPYWQEKMKSSIIVLSDDDFKDFVNLSTEVIIRTKIDNVAGTVRGGALFTEEYLPTESVLYSMILAAPEFKENGLTEDEVTCFLRRVPDVMQIGGSSTLGKGIVRTKFLTELSTEYCEKLKGNHYE